MGVIGIYITKTVQSLKSCANQKLKDVIFHLLYRKLLFTLHEAVFQARGNVFLFDLLVKFFFKFMQALSVWTEDRVRHYGVFQNEVCGSLLFSSFFMLVSI